MDFSLSLSLSLSLSHFVYMHILSSSDTISTASLKSSALEKESGESMRDGESTPRRELPPLASPASL